MLIDGDASLPWGGAEGGPSADRAVQRVGGAGVGGASRGGWTLRHKYGRWPTTPVLRKRASGRTSTAGAGGERFAVYRREDDARLPPRPGRVPRRRRFRTCPDPARPSRATPTLAWETEDHLMDEGASPHHPDPTGRRYRLALGLAAAATLCGARGSVTSGCATSRRRCCATSAAAVSTAPTKASTAAQRDREGGRSSICGLGSRPTVTEALAIDGKTEGSGRRRAVSPSGPAAMRPIAWGQKKPC